MTTTKVKDLHLSDDVMNAEQVSSYVQEALSVFEDFSAIEVLPTNATISAGTIDSYASLSDVLPDALPDDSYTGLEYVNDIEPCATAGFELYIRNAEDLSKCNVFIDWGDGTVEHLYEMEQLEYDVDERGTPILDGMSGIVLLSGRRIDICHTYTTFKKHIVKIYGSDCYMIRGYMYAFAVVPGKSTNNDPSNVYRYNLISRMLDINLPLSKNITNLASCLVGATKILKLDIASRPYNLVNLSNFANNGSTKARPGCKVNLQTMTIDDSFFRNVTRKTDYSEYMFEHQTELREYNGCLPSFMQHFFAFFEGCSALSSDIENLLPKAGFEKSNVNLQTTFRNCSSIVGTPPADILWESSSVEFSHTNTFAGCTSLDLTRTPVDWGGSP